MRILFVIGFLLGAVASHAGDAATVSETHPFYIGLNGGYGSTIWKGLVPRQTDQLVALSLSTPMDVHEGGFVWGGMFGFEFSPRWGIELNYLAYPSANVFFDEVSLFAFENDGQTELHTRTETVSLMAKIMLPVTNTRVRAYSSIGVGWIHRSDVISNMWLAVPSFGVGLNYPLSQHFTGELAANYMSGYGESELSPVNHYIPFLYAVYCRVIYKLPI